ncbi:MAG: dihydrolipoyl dehydrogenase [Candidatus Omnitrophota bacterium]|nr:dihydrolipoyl dehydrogenase [Candidatus Omnitrophota bacterium]
MPDKREVVIIGSGPGGYVAAIRLAQLGKRVSVIDIDETRLGGVCLNEGCVPVKSLINSASVFSVIKKSDIYGLEADVKPPDMKRIVAVSKNVSAVLRNGLKGLFKKNGIEFIGGTAKLLSDKRVEIESKNGREEIGADNIIIAVGSSPKQIPNVVPDGRNIFTSTEAIRLETLPGTMLVIGAGAIGVELASMFSSLGTKVTIIEMLPHILPFKDEEISKTLERAFKKRGVEVFTNAKVRGLNKKGSSLEAVFDTVDGEKKGEFEYVLVAAGRRPNTEGLGLEKAGVKTEGGFIAADEKMRTSVKNIYAIGDVLNTPMYAHVAYREGIIAAESIAGVKSEIIDYDAIPHVIFSEPQIAGVGLTEGEAREKGYDAAISKHFFKANSKAVINRSDEGFIKIIADKKTRKLLGVYVIGEDATEIIHEFVLAKTAGLTVDDIARAVHAHPTLSEIASDAAKAVFGKPIHG